MVSPSRSTSPSATSRPSRPTSASLFYRSALGLQPDESLELADPYGLIRSRAVTAPDGAVRIALNVAPGPGEHDLPWPAA